MDRRFQRLLEDLKSTSYPKVYHALIEVRSLLQTHRPVSIAHRLRKNGVTKLLIRLLKKKYEKLVNLTISILGTCCLEFETRVLLQQAKIPVLLMSVQEEFKEKDNIQSRVCRCVGNLAALPLAASDFHEAGFVPVLVDIIKPSETNQSSLETKQMAIRALRVLGDTGEHRQELLKEGAVRVIADHLSSEDPELVKAALKTLVSFCSLAEGAQQVQGNNNDGFKQLVKLASTGPKPELALMCICHLAHISTCRPDLGNAGAITAIFEELKKPSHKSEPRAMVTALIMFCSEIVNRAKFRDNNHLPEFLDLYRSPRYEHLHEVILKGILGFLHDEISLRVMLDNGLVPALIAKLRLYIRCLLPMHREVEPAEPQDSNRRMSVDSDLGELNRSPSWHLTTHSDLIPSSPIIRPQSPTNSWCLSPQPSPPHASSGLCWSPAYSSCSGQTETYSPVYEDSSSDDDNNITLDSDDDLPRMEVQREESECHPSIVYVFVLLAKICFAEWPVMDLVASSTVKALLAYLVVGKIHAFRANFILLRIVEKSQFLLPLVQLKFALLVQSKLCERRHRNHDCTACNRLTKLGSNILSKLASRADCSYGEGELAYLLQKGKQDEKQSAALSIPFIIRSRWLLKKLLLTHGGFSTILSLLDQDLLPSYAIMSLTQLASSLGVTYISPGTADELFHPYKACQTKPSDVITFILDDGSQVQADRSALVAASEVFSCMLHGDFRESKESEVELQDITRESLVLLLVHYNCFVLDGNFSVGALLSDVITILELLMVSDKFLLSDLNSKLLNYTKINYFKPEHFGLLCKWCSEKMDLFGSVVVSLFEDACAYLLVGPMKHSKRIKLFDSVKEAGMWESVKSLISSNLSQRMKHNF